MVYITKAVKSESAIWKIRPSAVCRQRYLSLTAGDFLLLKFSQNTNLGLTKAQIFCQISRSITKVSYISLPSFDEFVFIAKNITQDGAITVRIYVSFSELFLTFY